MLIQFIPLHLMLIGASQRSLQWHGEEIHTEPETVNHLLS